MTITLWRLNAQIPVPGLLVSEGLDFIHYCTLLFGPILVFWPIGYFMPVIFRKADKVNISMVCIILSVILGLIIGHSTIKFYRSIMIIVLITLGGTIGGLSGLTSFTGFRIINRLTYKDKY